ncbi:RimK family alpha-L-glutamate ligase [Candidatus Uhrbacteria bacterium]|nr:RimK family alpha-L-glutamate ligase [Candidatus Uhrbacteria bacterium]
MRIGILIFSKPKENMRQAMPGTVALMEAAARRGHQADLMHEPFLSIHDGGTRAFEIRHEGSPLPAYDAIIPRPNFLEEPSLHAVTVDALVAAGLPILNGRTHFLSVKNKLAQKLVCAEAGLPLPRWVIVRHPEYAWSAAKEIGFPIIVKVPFGRGGKGVFYVENKKTLLPLIDYLNVRDKNPVILEEYIEEAEYNDLRAFVVGGRIVAAMERTAKLGDVRANIHAGGTGRPVALSPEETELTLKAADAFGLEIAGVDVIRSKRGPLLLEVNAHPGFEAVSAVTQTDVADAIIAYVEARAVSSLFLNTTECVSETTYV